MGDKLGLQIVYLVFVYMQKKVNENVIDLKVKVGRFNFWLFQLVEVFVCQGLMGSNVCVYVQVKGLDVIEYCWMMVFFIVFFFMFNDCKI